MQNLVAVSCTTVHCSDAGLMLCCDRTAANAKKSCDVSKAGPGEGGGGGAEVAKLDIEAIVAKLLVGVAPNLIWVTQRNKIDWKRLRKDQVSL